MSESSTGSATGGGALRPLAVIRQWAVIFVIGLALAMTAWFGCGSATGAVCGDSVCDEEAGETQSSCPADCALGSCGDGVCTPPESIQLCPVDCFCGNTTCDDQENTTTCPSDCTVATCGNQLCEPGEDSWDCLQDCPAVCGNGVLDNGEPCDGVLMGDDTCASVTGHDLGELGCLPTCELDTSGCHTCGDGVLHSAEECDGPELGGLTCQARGHSGGTLSCAADCTPEEASCYDCGDGIIESPEVCDGGVLGPGAPTCQDLGQLYGTPTCASDCLTVTDDGCFGCGDGLCNTAMGETYALCPADCGFVAIYAEGASTCALRRDSTVWCWGVGFDCQIGDGHCLDRSVPTRVVGIDNAVDVAPGRYNHHCALLDDGTIRCWGANDWGVFGNGTETPSATPVPVGGISDAVAIGAGGLTTCAVRSDGTTWCWGFGSAMLGIGSATPPDTCWPPGWSAGGACALNPMQTILGSDAVDVSMRSNANCILESTGAVWCWGNYWNTTNGAIMQSSTPDRVDGANVAALIDVSSTHGCMLDDVSALWCWGSNEGGQLGNGTTGGGTGVFEQVTALPQVLDVAAGGRASPWSYTCAVDSSGHVWCWGYNYRGQLGMGNTTDTNTPAQVPGLSNITAVAAGGDHTCALDDTGAIWCWGHNHYGQLGINSLVDHSSPQPVVMP